MFSGRMSTVNSLLAQKYLWIYQIIDIIFFWNETKHNLLIMNILNKIYINEFFEILIIIKLILGDLNEYS